MALFYYSTNGYNWLECSANILNSQCNEFRYLSTLNECVWYGNRCAGNDMYSIIFDNNGLSGTIPSEISNLSSLQEITLANNQLNGDIPIDVDLPNLQVLDVSYNSLDGAISESIGNSRSLVVGKFQSNDINGQMPQSICENASTGDIQVLESDCSGGENAQVICDCCTS